LSNEAEAIEVSSVKAARSPFPGLSQIFADHQKRISDSEAEVAGLPLCTSISNPKLRVSESEIVIIATTTQRSAHPHTAPNANETHHQTWTSTSQSHAITTNTRVGLPFVSRASLTILALSSFGPRRRHPSTPLFENLVIPSSRLLGSFWRCGVGFLRFRL